MTSTVQKAKVRRAAIIEIGGHRFESVPPCTPKAAQTLNNALAQAQSCDTSHIKLTREAPFVELSVTLSGSKELMAALHNHRKVLYQALKAAEKQYLPEAALRGLRSSIRATRELINEASQHLYGY